MIKYLQLLTASPNRHLSDLFDGMDLDRPQVPLVFHTPEGVAGQGECIDVAHRLLLGRSALVERLGRRTTLAFVQAEEVDEIIKASHDCIESPAYLVCGVGPVCEAEKDYLPGADGGRPEPSGQSRPER